MSFDSFYGQFDNYRDIGANDNDKGKLKEIYNNPGNYTEDEIKKAYRGAINVDRGSEKFYKNVGSDDDDLVFQEDRYNTAKNTYQSGLNSLLVRAKRPSDNSEPKAKPKPKPKPKKEEPEGPVEYSPEIQQAIARVRNYESPFGGDNANTEDRGYNGFGNSNQGEEEFNQKQEPQVDPQSFLDKYKVDFKTKPTVSNFSNGEQQ